MDQYIRLQNEFLTATVALHGAELRSVRCGGREYLWQGDPAYWTDHAPVLFPICGSVREDWYELEGQRYELPKHGFAMHMDFTVDYQDAASAVLLLEDTPETRRCFPFPFQLRVTYQLVKQTVKVCYDVLNTGEKTMYFALGAHEGYALPGGLEEYELLFPYEEAFAAHILEHALTTGQHREVSPKSRVLPLRTAMFDRGALVFDHLRSTGCFLQKKDGSRRLRIQWEDFKNLLIWTKPGASFVCLEPWSTLPDPADSDHDFTQKPQIIPSWPNETVSRAHSFEILR